MQNITQTLKQVGLLTAALALALAANFAYGQWADPTSNPPGGNTDVPVNISSDYQVKDGDLEVESAYASSTNSREYCDYDGNNCFTAGGDRTFVDVNVGTIDTSRLHGQSRTSGIMTLYSEAYGCTVRTGSAIRACPLGQYVAGEDGTAAICCPFVAPPDTPTGLCIVDFNSNINGQTRAWSSRFDGLNGAQMGIGMYYYGDADDHVRETNPNQLPFTRMIHARNWGSSWIDSSEMVESGYFNAQNWATNSTALLSYNSRAYIVTRAFPVTDGTYVSISNKSVSEISAGTARLTARVACI